MKSLLSLVILAIASSSFVVMGDFDEDFIDSFEDEAVPEVENPVPLGDVKEAAIAIPSSGGEHGGAHGSNYAGFNGRCALDSEPGLRCNPAAGLTCDMRICKCKNSTVEQDLVYTYAMNAEKCVQVARAIDRWACEYQVQCTRSRLGQFSQCPYSGLCECADTERLDRKVIMVDDVCRINKEIGSQCKSDVECQTTIKGNAVCLGASSLAFGVCECAGGNSYDPLLEECLEMGTNEESRCKSDRQCDHETALGELARCNPDTARCECWDTHHNGNSKTAFYRLTQKCFYMRGQNETCKFREECSLGFDRKSDCLPHPAYNDEKICQCLPGEKCSASGIISFSLLVFFFATLLQYQ